MPDKIWCEAYPKKYLDRFYGRWTGYQPEGKSTEYTRTDIAQSLADALEGGPTSSPDFLEWIADRLVNVYGESDNVDFVLSLRQRAKQQKSALANYRKGE